MTVVVVVTAVVMMMVVVGVLGSRAHVLYLTSTLSTEPGPHTLPVRFERRLLLLLMAFLLV